MPQRETVAGEATERSWRVWEGREGVREGRVGCEERGKGRKTLPPLPSLSSHLDLEQHPHGDGVELDALAVGQAQRAVVIQHCGKRGEREGERARGLGERRGASQ
jgi:hypothetical protein